MRLFRSRKSQKRLTDDVGIVADHYYENVEYLRQDIDNVTVVQHVTTPTEVSFPVQVGTPPLPCDAYQFRPALVSRVDRELRENQTAVLTQVFRGDGGVGKTQLALSVFERSRRGDDGSPPADVAVWVSADSRIRIQETLGLAARKVGALDSLSEIDPSAQAAEFLSWLRTTARCWIVVLDNVESLSDLEDLWPTGDAGKVIVTTRLRDFSLARHKPLDVGVFSPEEARSYLSERLDHDRLPRDVLDEADELAEDLGYLPIALSQAAAVVASKKITCGEFRSSLADRARKLEDVLPPDAGDQHRYAVAAAWDLALERADALGPSGLGRDVMSIAAVTDPDGTPEQVFTSRTACSFFSAEGSEVSSELARDALLNLDRLSLVTHDPNDAHRSVRVHRLAQRAMWERLDDSRRDVVARTAAVTLLEIWPELENDSKLGAVLRSCTLRLIDKDEEALLDPEWNRIRFRLIESLGEAGLVDQAVVHAQILHDDLVRALGPDHPDTLATRNNVAFWRAESGDLEGALAESEQLLSVQLRVLGAEHPDTLATRNNVALWRGNYGDVEGALAVFEQLLGDQLRVFGPEHLNTLTTRDNIAHFQGRLP